MDHEKGVIVVDAIVTFTKEDYTKEGRRHSSDRIDRECQEMTEQWRRDLPVLQRYGQTQARYDLFLQLMDKHRLLREKRPQGLAEKEELVRERNDQVETGWDLASQAVSVLTPVAREDADCASRLKLAMPAGDLDLARALGSLSALLEEKAGQYPPETEAPALVAAMAPVRERLTVIFGLVDEAKGRPVADTAELDELDGRLYRMMVDVNAAGRRAVRAGLIPSRPPFYRFNHLRKSTRKNPDPVEPPVA
ncbi:MAG: hypothetical protein CVU65_06820 [Deltaproteobacteria bacterium HGW-Deltaproteobacteria-22]|jgi:hypothetical protein|nr:MAG: hypothetical protein CVU65_06820 [Deltaproteobacteria bacterium HGW-Deltaproteobacteria-22]